MIKKEKLTIVTDYLAKAFDGYAIKDRFDFEHDAQSFTLTKGATRYILKVTEDFFTENSPKDMLEALKDKEVAEYLRASDTVIFNGRNLRTLRE